MNGLPVKQSQLYAQDANLLIGTGPERQKLEARFWAKVKKDSENKCWEWLGSTGPKGYGIFSPGTKTDKRFFTTSPHRFAYWLIRGPIPNALEIDHLCSNRKCVNPLHLEAVTHAENIRRGNTGINNASKTHCPRGHPYDSVNTIHTRDGERRCRICKALLRHRDAL